MFFQLLLIVSPPVLSQVMINRTNLPGAILFPSIKYKEVWVEVPATEPAAVADTAASDAVEGGASATVPTTDVNTTAEGGVSSAVTTSEGESPDKPSAAVEKDTTTSASTGEATVADNNAGVFRLMFEMRINEAAIGKCYFFLSLLFIHCL